MNFEALVTDYGYLAVLVGTLLEGEAILIIAGFLAHRGYLELPVVIAVAFVGTLLGDQLYFYLGRIKGRSFIDSRPAWKAKTERVFRLMEKNQVLLILGFRFIYGIRTVASFTFGASGMSPLRYLTLNTVGALIWAVSIGLLGYCFGQVVEVIIGDIKQYEQWILYGLVALAVIIWLIYKWRDKNTVQ